MKNVSFAVLAKTQSEPKALSLRNMISTVQNVTRKNLLQNVLNVVRLSHKVVSLIVMTHGTGNASHAHTAKSPWQGSGLHLGTTNHTVLIALGSSSPNVAQLVVNPSLELVEPGSSPLKDVIGIMIVSFVAPVNLAWWERGSSQMGRILYVQNVPRRS